MHIGEDGRIVHFVYTDSSGSTCLPMMLWSQPLSRQGCYLIGLRPGHKGWTVEMIPTANGMTVNRSERQVHLVAASESEIPDWYAQRLEEVLDRMSQREAEAKEAEQAAPSDGEKRPN